MICQGDGFCEDRACNENGCQLDPARANTCKGCGFVADAHDEVDLRCPNPDGTL
jgi:hypothetical protein